MKRFLGTVALAALLAALPARAAEGDLVLELGPDGRIQAERSLALRVLALPYEIFALTAWPLSRLVFWMEDVNFPGRVGAVLRAPAELLPHEDEP